MYNLWVTNVMHFPVLRRRGVLGEGKEGIVRDEGKLLLCSPGGIKVDFCAHEGCTLVSWLESLQASFH